MNRYCEVCNSEPCGDACHDECMAEAHFREATTVIDGVSLCDEHAMQIPSDVPYRAGYAYACGYHD